MNSLLNGPDDPSRAATHARVDEFLAMLAHELRNPLNAIAAAVGVQGQLASDDPRQPTVRATIARQVRHLARIVDDLLEVSRLTRGQLQLHPNAIDLRSVVEQAAQVSARLADAPEGRIRLVMPGEPLLVHADAVRLEQALVNVLDNAAKYSAPDSRIEVLVERASPTTVTVRIVDYGIGIAPDQLDAIFDLFVQLDRSLARSQGGLGIGLSIARSVIELHGGTISAESAGTGLGTRILIMLPLSIDAVTPADRPGSDQPAPAAVHLNVLIVEDNPDAAELLRTLLESWGHSVRVAHDGIAGVRAASLDAPQVAIVDIGLPGLNGYEVAQHLRATPDTRETYLVAITGYGRPEDRARAREAGFDDFIVKPLDFEALEGAICAASSRTG
ncbi:MAG TPA: ATP-binding protein [Vicinamibacterales bacterium]|jgi:CheY-like chemotaxis protein|nr:ATP-binding protein [Vicinamibacterales bacterium]